MRIFFLLIFLTACRHGNNEEQLPGDGNAEIKAKLSSYCEKSKAQFLARKWAVDECDGLLFTALRGIACGDIDIFAFESAIEPGQWYRNPKKDCYVADQVNNGSDSTISKDMYIGLTAYLLFSKDSQALRRTIEYGQAHNWIVGEAKDNETLLSKCFITPSLVDLIQDAAGSLGSGPAGLRIFTDIVGVATGFRAHLDVLAIMLRGKIHGHIDAFDIAVLKEQAKRQPNNALFQAVKARYDDADYSASAALLLDEKHWPSDRLPNNHQEHCSNYIYQRDDDPSDWSPCPDASLVEFDGTDFLFAASIVTGQF